MKSFLGVMFVRCTSDVFQLSRREGLCIRCSKVAWSCMLMLSWCMNHRVCCASKVHTYVLVPFCIPVDQSLWLVVIGSASAPQPRSGTTTHPPVYCHHGASKVMLSRLYDCSQSYTTPSYGTSTDTNGSP